MELVCLITGLVLLLVEVVAGGGRAGSVLLRVQSPPLAVQLAAPLSLGFLVSGFGSRASLQ